MASVNRYRFLLPAILTTFTSLALAEPYEEFSVIPNSGHTGFINTLSTTKAFVRKSEGRTTTIGIRFPASILQRLPGFPGRTKERELCNEYPCIIQNAEFVCNPCTSNTTSPDYIEKPQRPSFVNINGASFSDNMVCYDPNDKSTCADGYRAYFNLKPPEGDLDEEQIFEFIQFT